MTRRRSEDVEITGYCQNDSCGATGCVVHISGRFNAEGEFEAHEEDDLTCDECGEVLDT